MADFEDKVALVTGAASGIGRATALAFAGRKAQVAVSDVSVKGGQETVELIEEMGGRAFFVRADVSSAGEVEAMVAETVSRLGGLDCAVNNAGTEGQMAPTPDYDEDAFNRVLAINLTGVWLCMKQEIPRLIERGGGAIVNVSSIAGVVGFPNTCAYTASKHGVLGLTRTAAIEYAPQDIRVNAVCPGIIETPMVMERALKAGADPEVYKQLAELHPVGRMGKAEEVARAILWLCSDDSSFVTGHPLLVDGGYVAR